MSPLLHAEDLHLSFGQDVALSGASLSVEEASSAAVMGPSGSGKSSLLRALCGVVVPDSGSVTFAGDVISAMSDRRRSRVRLQHFGIVFQFGELVPELTLIENVALPAMLLGASRPQARQWASELMDALGVLQVADAYAGSASGGQIQRAAVARALVHRPRVVLADEPTGALDTVTAEIVLDLLVRTCAQRGAALLVITHDHRVAAQLDRSLSLRDGRLAHPVPSR